MELSSENFTYETFNAFLEPIRTIETRTICDKISKGAKITKKASKTQKKYENSCIEIINTIVGRKNH